MQESTPSVFKKNKDNRILLLVDSVLSSESPVWSSIILYQVTHSCCTDTKRFVNVLVTLSDVKMEANREAAEQCAERAREAVRAGTKKRARNSMCDACRVLRVLCFAPGV